jgi:LysR family transcriptional regulator, regulator of abg operon
MIMNLIRLQRFLSVYRNESFSRAADELGMTHSALTKAVQLLEQELGAALFDRTTRVVIPTEAGHRLAARAEELLAFAAQVGEEAVSGQRHIQLIAGPAVIEASLAPVLAAFYKARPDIRVTAETMPPDIAIARLQRREVQLLLYHSTTIRALPDQRAFRMTPIIDEAYVAVLRTGHPLFDGDRSLDAMIGFQWAIPGYDRFYRSAIPADIERKYRRAGFPHYRILNLGTCLALAASSDLIALLPENFARREAPRLGLEIMPMPFDDSARYAVSAITLARQPFDPIVEDLIGMFAAGANLASSAAD